MRPPFQADTMLRSQDASFQAGGKESARVHHPGFRITKLGWYFVAINLALGAAALRTSNNLLFLLLGTLLGTLLLNGIIETWNLHGLKVRRHGPTRAEQYVPFLMDIELVNDKRILSAYGIEAVDVMAMGVVDKRCYFLRVGPRNSQATSYRHAFVRRGPQTFVGSIVSTSFPFGLVRRSRFIPGQTQILVHPSPRPVRRDEQDSIARWTAHAPPVSARWGSPRGLREYRPGDDSSMIHHKASAHLGILVVREMEDDSGRRVLLLVDNALKPNDRESYFTAAERVEETIGRAATLTRRFLDAGFQVGLADRERRLDFGTGRSHLTRALDFLALTPYSDESVSLTRTKAYSPETFVLLLDEQGIRRLEVGTKFVRRKA